MNNISTNFNIGKSRKSNFELLRLISMLMILNLHSFWGYKHGVGYLQAFDFFRESTSICAVNVFILISGYFGIHWKFKSFFNLIFQIVFYSFIVYGVCVWIGVLNFDKHQFSQCFKATFSSWGFITSYIALYFISPCLNTFVDKVTSKQLLIFILCFYIGECFIFHDLYLCNFFLVYLIGRWIRRTDAINRLQINATSFYWATTCIITILVYLIYRFMHLSWDKMTNSLLCYSYAAPLVIIQSVFLFICFGRIKIQSNIINWLATSCLSIFLIHMHPDIKYIGYYHFTESLYFKSIEEHIGILFLLFFCVFFGSIFIDKIRIIISQYIYIVIEYIWKKFPKRLTSLSTYLPLKIRDIL